MAKNKTKYNPAKKFTWEAGQIVISKKGTKSRKSRVKSLRHRLKSRRESV